MTLQIVTGLVAMASIISDRRLFLAADKQTVVEDGDPEAAYLLAGEGCEIFTDEVQRLGLTVDDDGKVVLPGAAKSKGDKLPESLKGVNFASDKAAEAAIAAELNTADFEGKTGKGAGGAFNTTDVKAIVAAKPAE